MIKTILISACVLLLSNCKNTPINESEAERRNEFHTYNIYSKEVKGTFLISVYQPNKEHSNQQERYPVVYVLDANLYFDMVAAMCKGYEKVGLLPPMIVVGIGYRDIYAMDSLRNRDYTYPEAIPIYEMNNSGHAKQFLSFIERELVPEIDSKFKTDPSMRILAGHSLGGYFALFAMQQNFTEGANVFSNYISASPSLHYNHYFILDELAKSKRSENANGDAYIAYGGLEDFNDGEPIKVETKVLFERLKKSINVGDRKICEIDAYSNLNHMQTAMPAFLKGLEGVFDSPTMEK